MRGTSSSRTNELNHDDDICPRCHMQGARKLFHSSQNPRREYRKCLRCDKFLKWVNHENDMERRIMMMLTDIKNELSELRMLVKLIEKGQSTIYMLLVGITVVLGIVVIV
uniref:Uncharacterized protein n=1 Tax=Opuntia streptacantha TaxID=393608 RepID=A0A7C9D670_OPUST